MNRFSIDLKSGLSYSNPFISKFNNAFDEIEFIVAKSDEFENCTFSVVYNVLGNCGMDIEGGGKLSRSTTDENVSLLWTLGNTVSLESGIVLYQVVAYKSDESGGTVAVWYSPQGRIIVGESIDTTEYETLQIGSQPSLVAQILSLITDVKSDVSDVDVQIKDALQSILVLESESADMAGEISEINKSIDEVFGKTEEISNNFEARRTEIDSQISDIRQNHTNTQKQISDIQTDLETKVDKVSGKQLSTEDYTTEEKNLVARLDKQVDDLSENVAKNATDIRNLSEQDFVTQGYVNEKISQIEESIGSVDLDYNPDSQNAQSGIAVAEGIGDVDEALREVVELQNKFIDGNYVVADQTYDPTSKNAQSGIAVAEAISQIPTGGGGATFFESATPQIDITLDEEVKTLTISELNGKPLAEYNYTTMRVLMENAQLEVKGENSEIPIRVNNNTYANETACSINAPSTFINNSEKQYWGGYINLIENLFLSGQSATGSEYWRYSLQMPANTSKAMDYKKIETIYISSVSTEMPIGTKIKIWLK